MAVVHDRGMIVRVADEPKTRTRRKVFHYVLEGNVLRHVSKYAVKEARIVGRKALKVVYDIPVERVRGKDVYEFRFSSSGGFTAVKFSPSELLEGGEGGSVSMQEVQALEFEVERDEVRELVREILERYGPMVDEINSFRKGMNISVRTSERVGDYLKDLKYGLAGSLCNWPEETRVDSLEQTSRLLYQLWTLKTTHEALGAVRVERGWLAEQGSKYPASVFVDDRDDYWTCWFEPQRVKRAPRGYKGPLTPLFERKIAWRRPTIVIARGRHDSLTDVQKFDILIECRNLPFGRWWRDGKVVREHFLPCKALFQPGTFIIASMKPVPDWAKSEMHEEGLFVVDEFYPGGKGLSQFKKLIRPET